METIGEHVVYRPPIETSEPGFKSVGHHSARTEERYEVSKFCKGRMTREGNELQVSSENIKHHVYTQGVIPRC